METIPATVVVFRGTRSLCAEFSLVLEARGIDYEVHDSDGSWVLTVAAPLLDRASDEIGRYSAERSIPRKIADPIEPHPGAALGASVYIAILLLVSYCAGNQMFGLDWLSTGSLDAGSGRQWWRAITALTLHLDQEHLLGNVLFGALGGIAAGRLLGAGVAWASILWAATLANFTEMFISPAAHHAVGASTAVFAALGLLTGMAWQQGLTARARAWYRWSPLIAGISLLTLLGAGREHVDVLGHGLGFLFGVGCGWILARAKIAKYRDMRVQIITGLGTVIMVGIAWLMAITHAA